jgi:hypothetical protein
MTARRIGLATLLIMLLAVGTAWAAFVQEAGSPYPTGGEPYAVYSADFNGDQRPDLAVLNGSSGTVNLYLRQAAGGFAEEAGSPFQAGFGPSFATIADFNNDARLDIAVANYSGSSVSLLTRQAAGGFTTTTVGSVSSASAIGAGDFNGDRQTDLVVAAYFNNQVVLLLGNGSGGFTTGQSFATGTRPRQIDVADFDGDSLADIAVTNDSSANLTVLRRSGTTFATETVPVGTTPQDLVPADFNGDGRIDLAVANNTGTVSVLLRGAGGFADEAGSPITVGGAPAGITTADFNRDDRPDLAVANGNNVSILLRNASGGFTADTPITIAGSYGIAAADFDRDTSPDIATTSLGTNTLSIFRGPTPPPVQTPTPVPPIATPTPTPVAPPVAGRSVNATPASGKVKVKLPGSKDFVDLSEAANLPVGTTVDTRDGKVTILAAGKGGQADFFDGLFKISQSKGSKPLTTLTLTETLSCPKKGKASASAKKKSRKLWGDGKGSFRTSGKYSAATVRGTKWLVTDRCDSTTTKVTQGVVSVRDNVKRRTVTVRKGKSYVARAKKR